MTKIGILHPGEMGVSIAASAINSGHQVYWTSQGRSDNTRKRATKFGLSEIHSLSQFCQKCEIILSICPPHASQDVAQAVIYTGFKGLYLDANAIAPQHSIQIGDFMEAAGIHFVDGGIIGGPAWKPKETWLYLSGIHAEQIAECFVNGPLETKIIGSEIGKASALKMCYAAYSKGTTALLTATVATAESLGVRSYLNEQWDMDNHDFSKQVDQRIRHVITKAWRFEGEMKEIAATFREAGLPNEFHDAAAVVYSRLAISNSKQPPTVEEIIAALLNKTI